MSPLGAPLQALYSDVTRIDIRIKGVVAPIAFKLVNQRGPIVAIGRNFQLVFRAVSRLPSQHHRLQCIHIEQVHRNGLGVIKVRAPAR